MQEHRIEIKVEKIAKPDKPGDFQARVSIGIDEENPPDFLTLMCAAEYLAAVVACESQAGYERALELIVQGAMTYKHLMRPRGES